MSPRANHVLLAAVCLAAVVAAIWLAIVPALTAVDVEQPRLNQAAPLPQGEAELTQTLRPAHNGLSAVELLAVRYEAPAGVAAAPAALTVELRDAAGCIIAAETFTTVAHNAPLTLRFAPQPRSAGQVYTLALRGTRGNALSAWAYGLDGYTGGDLQHDGVRLPGDLRFTTTYTYLWADVARDALRMVGRLGRLALPAWLVLFAPGLLLLSLAPRAAPAGSGRAARWGAA
ncbi:MAG: hypothetical protein IT318_11535, partial [Anaerolineales bacterium]|nr:hypothetical protein [Anaerolineales bacterium]